LVNGSIGDFIDQFFGGHTNVISASGWYSVWLSTAL